MCGKNDIVLYQGHFPYIHQQSSNPMHAHKNLDGHAWAHVKLSLWKAKFRLYR